MTSRVSLAIIVVLYIGVAGFSLWQSEWVGFPDGYRGRAEVLTEQIYTALMIISGALAALASALAALGGARASDPEGSWQRQVRDLKQRGRRSFRSAMAGVLAVLWIWILLVALLAETVIKAVYPAVGG